MPLALTCVCFCFFTGGQEPGQENNYGRDFYFDKFSQKSIIGIISGFYLFVIFVCTGVVVRKWFAFTRGTQRWETHQLAAMKTGRHDIYSFQAIHLDAIRQSITQWILIMATFENPFLSRLSNNLFNAVLS